MNVDVANLRQLIDETEERQKRLYEQIQAIDDPNLLLQLGDDLADRPEFSVKFFDRMIALNPKELAPVIRAAYAYIMMGDDLDAYYMLRRAREIDPEHKDVKELATWVLSPTSRLPRGL